jgi:cytochrome c-type biogenesis protein CcmH
MRRAAANVGIAVAIVLLTLTTVGLLLGESGERDRASALEQRLRCPVCKSVSIDESQSPTAVAMRQVVAEQIAAGRSDAEIIDFFRARYGDWVLLDPPARGTTALLWLLPVGVMLIGVAVLLTRAYRARSPASAIPADDSESVAANSPTSAAPAEEP